MSLATFVRVVALSLNAAVIGMTVWVFYVYWVAHKKAKQADNQHSGLLPYHVMAVSLYAITNSIAGSVAVFEFRDRPLTLVAPLYMVSNALLIVALIFMLYYQHRRVRLTTVDALHVLAEECEPTELYRGKTP